MGRGGGWCCEGVFVGGGWGVGGGGGGGVNIYECPSSQIPSTPVVKITNFPTSYFNLSDRNIPYLLIFTQISCIVLFFFT